MVHPWSKTSILDSATAPLVTKQRARCSPRQPWLLRTCMPLSVSMEAWQVVRPVQSSKWQVTSQALQKYCPQYEMDLRGHWETNIDSLSALSLHSLVTIRLAPETTT